MLLPAWLFRPLPAHTITRLHVAVPCLQWYCHHPSLSVSGRVGLVCGLPHLQTWQMGTSSEFWIPCSLWLEWSVPIVMGVGAHVRQARPRRASALRTAHLHISTGPSRSREAQSHLPKIDPDIELKDLALSASFLLDSALQHSSTSTTPSLPYIGIPQLSFQPWKFASTGLNTIYSPLLNHTILETHHNDQKTTSISVVRR